MTQTSNLYPSVLQYLCTFNHLNLFLSVAFFLSRCNSALKAGHLGPVMCVFLKKHTSQTLCILCPFSQLCTTASYLSFYSGLGQSAFLQRVTQTCMNSYFFGVFQHGAGKLEKRKNKNTFFPHFQIIIWATEVGAPDIELTNVFLFEKIRNTVSICANVISHSFNETHLHLCRWNTNLIIFVFLWTCSMF